MNYKDIRVGDTYIWHLDAGDKRVVATRRDRYGAYFEVSDHDGNTGWASPSNLSLPDDESPREIAIKYGRRLAELSEKYEKEYDDLVTEMTEALNAAK